MAVTRQLRKVRSLLERANAEICRLSALPDADHTGLHVLLDTPPACALCEDIRRWQDARDRLRALDAQLQAEIARKELAQAADFDEVRHKGQPKINDETWVRELRTGDQIKVIAARLDVSERTVNNAKKKFRARLI